jgi:hypothetical protein
MIDIDGLWKNFCRFNVRAWQPNALLEKSEQKAFDLIGGKGGTRTLDPGIMRTTPGKKAQ